MELFKEFDELLKSRYNIIYSDLCHGKYIKTNGLIKDYVELISWHNGQNSTFSDLQLFAHGSLLSYENSMKTRSETIEIRDCDHNNPNAHKWFRDGLIPLTIDAGGDFLCIDEIDGKLYQFIHDDQIAYAGYTSINEWLSAHFTVYKNGLVKVHDNTVEFPEYMIKA